MTELLFWKSSCAALVWKTPEINGVSRVDDEVIGNLVEGNPFIVLDQETFHYQMILCSAGVGWTLKVLVKSEKHVQQP